MNKPLLFLIFALALTVGFILPAQPSRAKNQTTSASSDEGLPRSIFAEPRSIRAPFNPKISPEGFDSLVAKAQSEGSVRVIVGLRLDAFQPEGKLADSTAVNFQREAIARAESNFIGWLSAFNINEVKTYEFIPYAALTVDALVLDQLRFADIVTSIEEDVALAPTLAESVPLIGGPAAWAAGYTGSGQTVAVLDTGVDKAHTFLSGKVVSEACYSSNNPNSSSVCPGGVTSSTSAGSGVNCSLSINGCNHGTHVAGIAAGKGTSFSGVAKDASLIAVQIFSRFDSADDCKTTPTPCARTFSSDQLSGLERVYALRSTFNIAAVNMSIGGGRNSSNCDSSNASLKAAIDNLRSAGIATVIASGNDGYKDSIGSPACISTAISVGSTGDGSLGATQDVVVTSSNSASFLSLLAPGQWINSSVPGGNFSNFSGTSMATPHVAGAWAVIKSKKPTATVDEVFAALRDTGLPVTDTNGITKPRIKLDAAINAIGGGGGGCSTTPIAVGQTINGALATTDCRYPTGSSWYSDAYSFNGTAGQQVAISLSSSTFDTWVALVGPSGSELVNDDNGGGGTNSRIPATSGFFTLPSSGTFTIQASSSAINVTGSYTLTLIAPPTGVPNNNFANAQVISGSSGNVTGNNTGATKEPGEPSHAGNSGGASVWYQWQAPATTSVTMKTAGSGFDTLLAVYTGSSVSGLTPIASNDDVSSSDLTSQVTFNAVAGVTYRIAVDGFGGATGSLSLNWSGGPTGPANNNFASATTITGSSGSVTGNNTNATKEPGEPNHAANSGGVSVWYQWQAPASGSATFTTANSNFDTIMGVYTGSTVSGLTPVASNDDESFPNVLTSKITFSAVAGTTYRIAVDGYDGVAGNITLAWSSQTSIQVTVQTNPAGRSFTVDGTTLTAAQTFSWTPGSTHTISTTSTQAGTTGTQYVWNSWSDGGAISHSVTPAGASTYTANFATQFFLTMNAGAGGTVSPASAFFNSGQSVNISATPNANFAFTSWAGSGTGSFTGSTNPASVTMNAPITETASFTGSSSTVQFSPASFSVGEGAGFMNITVTRSGGSTGAVTVNYATSNGTAKEGKNYVAASGVVSFAAGETSKTFPVLIIDNSIVEGARTVNLGLSSPSGATLGAPNTAVLTINDNDSTAGANPLDTPRSFVQYDYYDFLGRYPDGSGWDFWTNQITNCGANTQCVEVQRINVSASFFLSIEFQQTGYLVERFYKVAFGNGTGNSTFGGSHTLPVPIIRFDEFLRDSQRIGRGVVVLAPGWEQLLESNKQAYAGEFVQTSRFIAAFPTTMTPAQFVDQLNVNAGNALSTTERTTAINLFGGAGNTTNTTARAQAVRQVADDVDLYNAEYNRAFVLAEYYGYLRRNPNDAPESTLDYTGYDFWLTKLNQFNGNYINAEMVKAFLSSIEYRQRFGP